MVGEVLIKQEALFLEKKIHIRCTPYPFISFFKCREAGTLVLLTQVVKSSSS